MNCNDLSLLDATKFQDKVSSHHKVTFLLPESENIIIRYNPLSLTMGGLMYFYQGVISKQIGATCPYEISCSDFSKRVIRRYGFLKGVPLTADRLTRCTRLSAIDFEPTDYTPEKHLILDRVEDYNRAH